jgi:hypothetical protein
MSLSIKALHGGGLQVEDAADHWVIFSLDELRSRSITLRADMVDGPPDLTPEKADLFVWAAFAAARGHAIEHGLIVDDRPPFRA